MQRSNVPCIEISWGLKLDIKEISALNEILIIYTVFENSGKINEFDIKKLIDITLGSLEIIKKKNDDKIKLLCDNLKILIKYIKNSLYDHSEEKKIKIYYKLLPNIFLNEIQRENSQQFKYFILEEFLLKDEILFIQSLELLKIILEEYVSPNLDAFQGTFEKLTDESLKILEDKMINNDWIKETILYIFEQLSIIYIQNSINDNQKQKEENQKNILVDLKSFLDKCCKFLEKLHKDPKLKNEKDEEEKINTYIKRTFSLSFIRVYLKTFIDWIGKGELKENEIGEIIENINGKESNEFRDMLRYFIYKIIYNIKGKDIKKLFDEETINKYCLRKYNNFELIEAEKKFQDSAKFIVFIEAYNSKNPDFQIFNEEFNLLSLCLNNQIEKQNELEQLIEKNKRIDIFYSVFSSKISAHLSNNIEENDNKIKVLSNIIQKIFNDKEKLMNIFNLFLDSTNYEKTKITPYIAEILQYCLKFCINADDISSNYDNMYYPLYNNDDIKDYYYPGNDIKDRNIYDAFTKTKKYLEENPPNHLIKIIIYNKLNENKENKLCNETCNENDYPKKEDSCKDCKQPEGLNKDKDSLNCRTYIIVKNKQDLELKIKKGYQNCMTLAQFYKDFIYQKLVEDSKGINLSNKNHFDKPNKPIRNQSQLGYRLMNLILYSHLFLNTLFTNKEDKYVYKDLTYLDYIKMNWEKLKEILNAQNKNIYIFMNLITTDLLNYLNKQERIESYDKLIKIEQEIENIIKGKLNIEEEIKDKKSGEIKKYTKYQIFAAFYSKNKEFFRDKNPDSKTSIIKEMNDPTFYKEKDYPYYKNFIYSDYPNKSFLEEELKNTNRESFPVIDLYLNDSKKEINLKREEFLSFNFVIKSLLNQYSYNISRDKAKKIRLEDTPFYKQNTKKCDYFIELINSKKNIKLNKESSLDNFFIYGSSESGKLYKEMYIEFGKKQNELLGEIVEKINKVGYNIFECPEIDIQEAKDDDLIYLEFKNKSQFIEILLSNINRDFYNFNSKIKYNNYNLFKIDLDNIEKIFEDSLVKNACFLKTDNILEIIYSGEDFLNDGISDFNDKIETLNLDDKDKMSLISFYEKHLKENLALCLKTNEELKNIIEFINKNLLQKQINTTKSLYSIIDSGLPYTINDDLKAFLKDNNGITINKLSKLIIYIECLYFELAMKERKEEYNVQLDEKTKNKIDDYYNEKKSCQLITKDKLSLTIIRFLLNIEMKRKANKEELFKVSDDNLFDYISNKLFWEKEIYNDNRFNQEIKEYKNFNIYIKNVYDFYSSIAFDSKNKFEKSKEEILVKINFEENKKKEEQKQREKEEINKEILKNESKIQEMQFDDDFDVEENADY